MNCCKTTPRLRCPAPMRWRPLRAGKAPLPAALWPRDAQWRTALRRMLDTLAPRLSAGPALNTLHAVRAMDDAALEQQAGRLLNGVMFGLDMAAAPLIAAGLQSYWTHLVLATEQAHGAGAAAGAVSTGTAFGRCDDATLCPCCASPPTASVSRMDSGAGVCRYLHCALCSTQWHMVRIQCSRCQSTKGIGYQSLRAQGDAAEPQTDPAPVQAQPGAAVEAETCDSCGHYLKILRTERDAGLEPLADDLATLTLDLLVSEAGFERHGVNLLLLFGDPDGGGGAGSGHKGAPQGGAVH